ncbi:MAG: T9SS type A sorting domain-containing protein [Bacteroidia bacterium]|nr:T9SS type A sorting domain-containing protein [Bacteroidia bacterium]
MLFTSTLFPRKLLSDSLSRRGLETAWFSFVATGQYMNLAVEPPNILSDTAHFHNLTLNACTILKLLFGYECELIFPTANNLRTNEQSIQEKNMENEYLGNCFPNPARDKVFIPYSLPSGSGGYIRVTELSGKILSETVIKEGAHTLELNVSALQSGVYLHEMELDGEIVSKRKLVVIKN